MLVSVSLVLAQPPSLPTGPSHQPPSRRAVKPPNRRMRLITEEACELNVAAGSTWLPVGGLKQPDVGIWGGLTIR